MYKQNEMKCVIKSLWIIFIEC